MDPKRQSLDNQRDDDDDADADDAEEEEEEEVMSFSPPSPLGVAPKTPPPLHPPTTETAQKFLQRDGGAPWPCRASCLTPFTIARPDRILPEKWCCDNSTNVVSNREDPPMIVPSPCP